MGKLNEKTKKAKKKLTVAFYGCLLLYLGAVAAVVALILFGITK